MPIVEANATRLHVQTLGENGTPVVMLHGLMASLSSWYFGPAPQISKRHRVILYDLRGHGLSERTSNGYGVSSLADDLQAVIGNFAQGPVHLVGHSYGSAVAMRYAVDHPEMVKGLFLIEVPFPVSATAEQVEQAKAALEYISQVDAKQDWLSLMPAELRDQVMEALPASVVEIISNSDMSVANRVISQAMDLTKETELITDILAEPDMAETQLAALGPKTTLCYGTRSPRLISREKLMTLMPEARVEMLEGGHFLIYEPAAIGPLTTLIEEFLGE